MLLGVALHRPRQASSALRGLEDRLRALAKWAAQTNALRAHYGAFHALRFAVVFARTIVDSGGARELDHATLRDMAGLAVAAAGSELLSDVGTGGGDAGATGGDEFRPLPTVVAAASVDEASGGPGSSSGL